MITVLVVILFLGIGVIISFVCEDISPILIVGVLSSVYGCSDIGVKKETPKSSVEKSIIKEAIEMNISPEDRKNAYKHYFYDHQSISQILNKIKE